MSNVLDTIQLSGSSYDLKDKNAANVSAVTQAEYDNLPTSAKTSNTLFVITDAQAGDLTQYWTSAQTNSAITQAVSGKQDTLVSGTNIKTINNTSILGSGNIDIQGGGGGKAIEAGRGISVASGDSAYTVSFNLPISADTDGSINKLLVGDGNTIGSDTYKNIVIGDNNTTFGGNDDRIYSGATIIGYNNEVGNNGLQNSSNDWSVAIGRRNKINGGNTYIIGVDNSFKDSFVQKKNYTYVFGRANSGNSLTSDSQNIFVFGAYNKVTKSNEFALGEYNVSSNDGTTSGNTFFSIGNGTSNSARHNAFEIRQNGDIYLSSGSTDIKLQDYLGGGGGTVESAITSGSTNAVESKAIWSATTYNKEITLQWDNGFPSKLSTNYPSGCKKFVVTVPFNNTAVIMLYNGGSQLSGYITINNYSSLSVSIDTFEGITYTISGNDVTFVIPNTITFDQLMCDIRSITSIKAIVEGAWIADNTYMKEEVDAIQNTLQNNINQKLDATAYTPVTIDSTLIENSTNPVEGGVLYDELIYKGAASETTIEWSGYESTNYPSGCTEIKVEVSGSYNSMYLNFINDEWQQFGNVYINNYGNITVTINDLQGATYEISGTTVTISYPSVTGVTKIHSSGTVTYTTKAVTYGASTTVKDALGGLKFVKLTQTEYDNLQTKDNNTLYVIVN